jgi:PIN domain nuclease of toxin-antitoxin system
LSVVADTHALVWYLFEPEMLSPSALAALDAATEGAGKITVSAMSLVELTYLVEKGRVPALVLATVTDLVERGMSIIVVPLDAAIAKTLATIPRSDIPDLPDRVIAATALYLGLPLVSRDGKILASSVQTIW